MLKLKIYSVGRPKERWIEEGIEEYIRRLKSHMSIECIWVKSDEQLAGALEKESKVICLDPAGKMLESEAFSKYILSHFEAGGSRLSIVIGGSDGLSPELKKKYSLLSLSPLTFTHQLTRLVLVEQVYRAVEIDKGSQYHK
ncbi:MAG: 23S rRNA (pseudouridine1915-N3)-methyltransferase [Chlamydiales bacterium]|jgi:23S rRNA (pseudouridine1915-N3)-methyltransferase